MERVVMMDVPQSPIEICIPRSCQHRGNSNPRSDVSAYSLGLNIE